MYIIRWWAAERYGRMGQIDDKTNYCQLSISLFTWVMWSTGNLPNGKLEWCDCLYPRSLILLSATFKNMHASDVFCTSSSSIIDLHSQVCDIYLYVYIYVSVSVSVSVYVYVCVMQSRWKDQPTTLAWSKVSNMSICLLFSPLICIINIFFLEPQFWSYPVG